MAKYMDTDKLLSLDMLAHQRKYTRVLRESDIKRLDPNGLHVITSSLLVEDGAIVRSFLFIKVVRDKKPHTALLDIAIADFNELPTLPESGSF